MRDAPALRYIEGKLLRERVGRLARDVVAPRAESRELPPVLAKRQIAVHHRADADAAERLERRLELRGDLRLDLRETGLDPGPDLLEIIRPDPVLELVLPAIARRCERSAILADEHRLDVRRAELDAERRLSRADLLRPACFLLATFCHKASLPHMIGIAEFAIYCVRAHFIVFKIHQRSSFVNLYLVLSLANEFPPISHTNSLLLRISFHLLPCIS